MLHELFSSCSEQAILELQFAGFLLKWLLSLQSRNSRPRGCSCCSSQGSRAQAQMWRKGFPAPRHVGSSWTRDQTGVSCIGNLILYKRSISLFPAHSQSLTCNARDPDLIPGSGRYPGERNGNPLQYSCLRNAVDRGAWWPIVHRVAKSYTRLSD